MSQSTFLNRLPESLRSLTISDQEVVLPEAAAIQAINFFEREGFLLLGWEGWIKTSDGRVGHGNAPQGTTSLEELTIPEAAELCRATIRAEAKVWRDVNPSTTDQLHFCLTVRERFQEGA